MWPAIMLHSMSDLYPGHRHERGGAQGEGGRKSVTVFLFITLFIFQLKEKNWRVFLAAD
jgi:hypothetical protein